MFSDYFDFIQVPEGSSKWKIHRRGSTLAHGARREHELVRVWIAKGIQGPDAGSAGSEAFFTMDLKDSGFDDLVR
jgi:hypothetical protein